MLICSILYFDIALPMGLKSAAFLCQKMTILIRHILEDEGFEFVNYLDDFGVAETWVRAHTAHAAFGDTLARAGLGDSVEKRVPLHVSMIFLSILFDSVQFTLSIDEEWLSEMRDLLTASWRGSGAR